MIYLAQKEAPIEALFYRFYESMDKIFYPSIIEGKQTFQFDSNCFEEDLHDIGIKNQNYYYENNLEELESLIYSLFDKYDSLFVYVNNKDIPHLSDRTGTHSLIIEKNALNNNSFIVRDWPDHMDSIIYPDQVVINAMLNLTPQKLKIATYYIASEKNMPQFIEKVSLLMENVINNVDLNFNILDELINILRKSSPDEVKRTDGYQRLYSFFLYMSYSRLLFAHFLKFTNAESYKITQIEKCSEMAELLKNSSFKMHIKKKCDDLEDFVNKVLLYKNQEELTLSILRNSEACLSLDETDTSSILKSISNLNAMAVTDCSVYLKWAEPQGVLQTLEYCIYVNNQRLMSTELNQCIVGELKSNTSYNISVTALYDKEKESEKSVVTIKTLQVSSEENACLFKPVYSSSDEDILFSSLFAVNGDLSNRWASCYSDTEWLCVDLCNNITINTILLSWEAHAVEYVLLASLDEKEWFNLRHEEAGKGGVEVINFSPREVRYIKMQGIRRASLYGYSLWGIEAYQK